MGLPRATAFHFGQGHFEAVFNFNFNSRRDQNGRAKSTSWSVWQSCFWVATWRSERTQLLQKFARNHETTKKQEGWHKHPRAELGRTTSWSPKSQCVYGPENEIAAVTFFAKNCAALKAILLQVYGMAGFRGTRLLIEGLYPRLHVANLCQSTMLFGIV